LVVYKSEIKLYDLNMFGSKKNLLVTDKNKILEAFDRRKGDLGRRLENEGVLPSVEYATEILSKGSRKIYLGIDPTGPDIHIGHTIPLLFLKQLCLRGHIPVIVIGDFTARIGDPTGKDTARKPLSPEQIRENSKDYLEQIYKIIPKDFIEIHHNADWLDKLSFKDVVNLASHVTVQQMIQRDMFQVRLSNEQPIGLHEFLYPLMQGYDSVEMKIDGEVGGNDQTFNMLIGRDLEKKLLNKDKLVFVTQLLVDATTGKKMSKSEGGLISLSDTPSDMFGKIMSVPDGFIQGMFKLCTERDMDWIDKYDDDMRAKPYDYKKELALELVRMYHGEKEAIKARNEWDKVFSRGELPSEIKEIENKEDVISTTVAAGVISSNSEAKRLIEQKAIKVNGKTIEEWDYKLKSGDIIQIGPKIFIKVK